MTTTSSFPAAARRAVPEGVLGSRGFVLRGLVLVAGALAFSTVTWAQGAEVAGFGGGSWLSGGFGTHGVFGGTGAVRIGDHIHVYGEINHSTILSENIGGVTGNAGLTNFGGGVDYSFGSSTSRLRPYVTAGLGVGHFSASAEGTTMSIGNSAYAAFGGGVRAYVGQHWGIKPEVRFDRYLNSFAQGTNGMLFTVGLFYQFGD